MLRLIRDSTKTEKLIPNPMTYDFNPVTHHHNPISRNTNPIPRDPNPVPRDTKAVSCDPRNPRKNTNIVNNLPQDENNCLGP